MARRGFRYVPLTQDYSISTFGVGSMLGFVPVPYLSTDLTVVEREGYGLYALEDASEDEDPNTAYLESISEAEADAYSIALNGDYRIPTTNGSCSREALDAHPEPTGYSDRTSVFHSEYDELIQTMISVTRIDFLREPSVMALNEQWESCMNSKGYVFDEANTGTGPLAAMSRAVHTRPDGTFAPTHGGELISDIPIDERSLSGTEFERKVAVDDYLCRQETNYLPAMTQIRQEIDEVLIAEHRVALDRLVSMAESW